IKRNTFLERKLVVEENLLEYVQQVKDGAKDVWQKWQKSRSKRNP
ncbi:hypothetical protein DBR06_SOUSAS23510008, partial [Sousa chinensis]